MADKGKWTYHWYSNTHSSIKNATGEYLTGIYKDEDAKLICDRFNRLDELEERCSKMEGYLRNRITELNTADGLFCKDRWDVSKPQWEKAIAREQSNNVTFARQELESALKAIELPRFI